MAGSEKQFEIIEVGEDKAMGGIQYVPGFQGFLYNTIGTYLYFLWK